MSEKIKSNITIERTSVLQNMDNVCYILCTKNEDVATPYLINKCIHLFVEEELSYKKFYEELKKYIDEEVFLVEKPVAEVLYETLHSDRIQGIVMHDILNDANFFDECYLTKEDIRKERAAIENVYLLANVIAGTSPTALNNIINQPFAYCDKLREEKYLIKAGEGEESRLYFPVFTNGALLRSYLQSIELDGEIDIDTLRNIYGENAPEIGILVDPYMSHGLFFDGPEINQATIRTIPTMNSDLIRDRMKYYTMLDTIYAIGAPFCIDYETSATYVAHNTIKINGCDKDAVVLFETYEEAENYADARIDALEDDIRPIIRIKQEQLRELLEDAHNRDIEYICINCDTVCETVAPLATAFEYMFDETIPEKEAEDEDNKHVPFLQYPLAKKVELKTYEIVGDKKAEEFFADDTGFASYIANSSAEELIALFASLNKKTFDVSKEKPKSGTKPMGAEEIENRVVELSHYMSLTHLVLKGLIRKLSSQPASYILINPDTGNLSLSGGKYPVALTTNKLIGKKKIAADLDWCTSIVKKLREDHEAIIISNGGEIGCGAALALCAEVVKDIEEEQEKLATIMMCLTAKHHMPLEKARRMLDMLAVLPPLMNEYYEFITGNNKEKKLFKINGKTVKRYLSDMKKKDKYTAYIQMFEELLSY